LNQFQDREASYLLASTRRKLNRIDEIQRLSLRETPVGFKFTGELVNEDKIILDGEKFTGMSVKSHDPAKDGITSYLLATEAVAVRGTSLRNF
jgi:phosphoglucomutase